MAAPVRLGAETRRTVFVCLPSYAGAHTGSILAAFVKPARRASYHTVQTQCSLLAQAFNIAWCEMLSRLEAGEPITHFAMLHADIQPEDWWADKLIDELDATGADVVSAVSPIKTSAGLVSAGIARRDDPWSPLFRFTMRQVMELPKTFGAADCGHPDKALLVNTGCWVARVDRSWVFDFPGFSINDRLSRVQRLNDQGEPAGWYWKADVEPEDWRASRAWHRMGLSVLTTRKVKLVHHGQTGFPNSECWGFAREDTDCDTDAAARLSEMLGVR